MEMRLPDQIAAENANPPFEGIHGRITVGSFAVIIGNLLGVALGAALVRPNGNQIGVIMTVSMGIAVGTYASFVIQSQKMPMGKFLGAVLLSQFAAGLIMALCWGLLSKVLPM